MHAIAFPNTDTRLKDVFMILGVSLLIGLVAWIKVPLPFTPVPVAFSPQAVILFSLLLGRKAVYAAMTYLVLGAIGLPLFAGGGSGLAYLFGPTGGYLVGYLVTAFVVGHLCEKIENRTPAKIFALMLVGNALVFAFGLPHLALFVGGENAIRLGLLPFIAGDVAKLIGINYLLKKIRYYG